MSWMSPSGRSPNLGPPFANSKWSPSFCAVDATSFFGGAEAATSFASAASGAVAGEDAEGETNTPELSIRWPTDHYRMKADVGFRRNSRGFDILRKWSYHREFAALLGHVRLGLG